MAVSEEAKTQREAFLDRGRNNSLLTLPYVTRLEGSNAWDDYEQPWESLGGFLVNNLSNKISQSLFPTGISMIRFSRAVPLNDSLGELPETERLETAQRIDARLAEMEVNSFVPQVSKDGDAITLTRGVRHLIITGNFSIQSLGNGKLKGRPLERFYTERDDSGNLINAELTDMIAYSQLDADIQQIIQDIRPGFGSLTPSTEVEVITEIEVRGDDHTAYTTVMGEEVPGSRKTYTPERFPYFFPTYDLQEGEHYGRSYVENYLGDLESLDAMSETVQRGTHAAAKLVALVRPGSMTSKKALQQARIGDFKTGQANDISYPVTGKGSDFAASIQIQDRIISRLNQAFLMGANSVRDAERVTAVEIQFLARELESQLGTSYSGLENSLQRPYATTKVYRMQRIGTLPVFDDETVEISILTGAAALTRQRKADQILTSMERMRQFMPEKLQERAKPQPFLDMLSEATGYNMNTFIMSDEEVEIERKKQLAEQTLSNQLSNAQPPQPQQPAPQGT